MGKTEKAPGRFLRFKLFLLSFLISLILLCLAGVPTLLVNGHAPSHSPAPEGYAPDWNHRLTLLLQVRAADETPAGFFLLGLHPMELRLYVTPLPRETWLRWEEKENTLAGFSRYGGVYLAAEALSQSCGIPVDRTASISLQRLAALTDRLGGVEWPLSHETAFSGLSGQPLSLPAGTHRLSGEQFAGLLLSGEEGPGERLEHSGALFAALLNQTLHPRTPGSGDRFAELANFFVTDLSYSDYLHRAEALDAISRNAGCTSPELVSGVYSPEQARFLLTEEALSLLQRRYPK